MAVKTPKKVTEEELKQLDNLQTKINQITIKFGSLQMSKIKIEKEEKELKNQLIILEKEEKEIANNLTKKYGKGRLNTDTGEFTPIE
tara:strand:+ start:4454 stop:4714 length:261 start_codon:yes stop_codon:yes gene_type:complete